MKKTIRTIAVVVLLIAVAISVTACGGPKKEDIVGHWEVYDRVLNFSPDGSFNISSSREWKTSGDWNVDRINANKYSGNGSWELYGNTVKTKTDKFGFIDFEYKDGELIDGDDIYTKENARRD